MEKGRKTETETVGLGWESENKRCNENQEIEFQSVKEDQNENRRGQHCITEPSNRRHPSPEQRYIASDSGRFMCSLLHIVSAAAIFGQSVYIESLAENTTPI